MRRAFSRFSDKPMMPRSAQPRRLSDVPAPEMVAVLKPARAMSRAEKPSYTPGVMTISGALMSALSSLPLDIADSLTLIGFEAETLDELAPFRGFTADVSR